MDVQRIVSRESSVNSDLLRGNFTFFAQQCFKNLHPGGGYAHNWHMDMLGEYLEACRQAQIRRLIVNIPPRSLKSIVISVAWPAFLLGHNPAERIIAASYVAGLSAKHSIDCRTILQSGWYRELFPGTELSHDQNQKHKFRTTAFGHRIASSVAGSITGEGGNILIVDDPQNPIHIGEERARRKVNKWFDGVFSTRLNNKDKGAILLVMQRLHEEDLTGYLLEKGGWDLLNLPAIAEQMVFHDIGTTFKTRSEWEILHARREDEPLLLTAKRELGSAAFAAQYQQNPVPAQGNIVKREWLRRYGKSPESFIRIVQSWDTAIKAGVQNDISVCMTFGERKEESYVLDVLCFQAEYPQLKRQVKRMAEERRADVVLIEDKASGQNLLQDMRREERHIPVIAICPVASKVNRFAAVSAMIEAGRLFLPQEAPWLAAFEQEVLAFPYGKRDDQVDALSQYLNWLRGKTENARKIRRL